MDLVRASAAGGIGVMASLMLAATALPGAAQSPIAELPAVTQADTIQARIDAAFEATRWERAFDVSGPLFPPTAGSHPVLPAAPSAARWPVLSGTTAAWSAYIDEAAARFGLPAAWLHGVMQVESGGRTHLGGVPITSPAGAMGLMQVLPTTFAEMRARYGLGPDPYDPRTNILAGAAYLREMYDRYGAQHFLAAYNAGPGRVDAWLRGRATLPAETRAYAATLAPKLGLAMPAAYVATSGAVQDLTSRGAVSALLPSSSRSATGTRIDVASSPVLAGRPTRGSTAERRASAPLAGGLFVTLSAVDRRREASVRSPEQD